MRHVRSHVMHKQQKRRSMGPRRRSDRLAEVGFESGLPLITRTCSPFAACSDSHLDQYIPSEFGTTSPLEGLSEAPMPHLIHSVRDLATQLIASITSDTVQSAPAAYGNMSEFPFPSSGLPYSGSFDELKHLYMVTSNLCRGKPELSLTVTFSS